ncbi:hypothetical protein GBAR_LOCUS31825 [Geodia barretti]|uniref:HTH psq-type domain-containing protein n=1 Tax=Geodia barretti TaxID=519541 RepID=A0AA35U2K7_GEOBA|nr:hypothetical protein GBAR_LOCUS31825 [Geodia barretti]
MYQLPLRNRVFRSPRSSLLSSCSSVTQRPTEYKTWDKDSMGKACRDVREGRLSIRRAAESYQVPKSTLSDHVTGRLLIKRVLLFQNQAQSQRNRDLGQMFSCKSDVQRVHIIIQPLFL